ncbi:hypothetical protein ABEB36_013824 [Hypothenemus hampei]|uniref:DUF4817 domain-containing protein n=1 Tax=Hypothenemus hampei TaxID=57062 RepID=A0ABD1E5D1_HYPHA
MVQFNNFEKTNMILIYGKCQKNSRLACRVYSERFPDRRCPDHKTLKTLVMNLQNYGAFAKPKRNRNRPIRGNNQNVVNVIAAINENPNTSITSLCRDTNISSTSIRRILQNFFITFYGARSVLLTKVAALIHTTCVIGVIEILIGRDTEIFKLDLK